MSRLSCDLCRTQQSSISSGCRHRGDALWVKGQRISRFPPKKRESQRLLSDRGRSLRIHQICGGTKVPSFPAVLQSVMGCLLCPDQGFLQVSGVLKYSTGCRFQELSIDRSNANRPHLRSLALTARTFVNFMLPKQSHHNQVVMACKELQDLVGKARLHAPSFVTSLE